MLYDLLRWDLSDFSVQNVPQTQALLDQKAHGMSPLEVWWEERLMDGRLYTTTPGWHRAECNLLYIRYRDEASALGDKHPHTKKAFVAAMRRLLPEPGIERKRGSQGKDKKRPWMWEFPPLERCRARWDKINKTTTDWHEEDEGDDSYI